MQRWQHMQSSAHTPTYCHRHNTTIAAAGAKPRGCRTHTDVALCRLFTIAKYTEHYKVHWASVLLLMLFTVSSSSSLAFYDVQIQSWPVHEKLQIWMCKSRGWEVLLLPSLHSEEDWGLNKLKACPRVFKKITEYPGANLLLTHTTALVPAAEKVAPQNAY